MKLHVIIIFFSLLRSRALKHYKTSVFRESITLKLSKNIFHIITDDHIVFKTAKSALAVSLLFTQLLNKPAYANASPDQDVISDNVFSAYSNGLSVVRRDLESTDVSLQSDVASNGADFLGKVGKLNIGNGNGFLNFGKATVKLSIPHPSLPFPIEPRKQSTLLTTTMKTLDQTKVAKKSSYLDDAMKRLRTWDIRCFGSNNLIQWSHGIVSNPPPLYASVFTIVGLVIIADCVQDARYVRNLLDEQSVELKNLSATFAYDKLKHEQSSEALLVLKGESDKLIENFKALVVELEDKSQQVLALNTTIQFLSLAESDHVRSLSDEASGLKQQLLAEKRHSGILAQNISKLEADLRFSEQMKSNSEKKLLDLTESQDALISNLMSFLIDEKYVEARSADKLDLSNIGSFFSNVKASGSLSTSLVASLEIENRELRDTVTSYSAKLAEALDNDKRTRLQLDYYNATLLSQADLLRNLSRRLELAEAEISGSAVSNIVSDSDGIITRIDSTLVACDDAPIVENAIHAASVDTSQAEGVVIRLVDDLSAENDDLKQLLIDSDERFWQMERDPVVHDEEPAAAKSTPVKRKSRPVKVLSLEPPEKNMTSENLEKMLNKKKKSNAPRPGKNSPTNLS